jgi:hypothetical protein
MPQTHINNEFVFYEPQIANNIQASLDTRVGSNHRYYGALYGSEILLFLGSILASYPMGTWSSFPWG